MHLDALADALDALGASTRARALEIMRDPRIGSFGAAGISIDLLLKAAAVATLLDHGRALPALVAAGAASRAAAPALASVLPYPRPEGGPGSVLTGRVAWRGAGAAGFFAVALSLVAGVDGLLMVGAVAIVTVLLGVAYSRWLGGATGDCLGAATEIAETAALLVVAALA
jgi:adenosylcobinamide-GDP ribazoletransferase